MKVVGIHPPWIDISFIQTSSDDFVGNSVLSYPVGFFVVEYIRLSSLSVARVGNNVKSGAGIGEISVNMRMVPSKVWEAVGVKVGVSMAVLSSDITGVGIELSSVETIELSAVGG